MLTQLYTTVVEGTAFLKSDILGIKNKLHQIIPNIYSTLFDTIFNKFYIVTMEIGGT